MLSTRSQEQHAWPAMPRPLLQFISASNQHEARWLSLTKTATWAQGRAGAEEASRRGYSLGAGSLILDTV